MIRSLLSATRARMQAPLAATLLVLLSAPALAQNADSILAAEGFVRPPAEIAQAVLAPRHLNVSLTNQSPNKKYFLKTQSEGLPSIAEFAKPHHFLGGLQVDSRANRARTFTTRGSAGFDIIEWETGRTIQVQVPRGATVSNPTWSPDGSQVGFFAHFAEGSHIFVADAATGRSRQVTRTPVLATLVTSFDWTADGRSIVTVLLPPNRGAAPRAPAVPTSPMVRLTGEGENRTRTYASLLETPHDMALLEYYATGQLAVVTVQNRAERRIGPVAMIQSVDPSPDGQYFRVTTMQKPFSYIVPTSQFGTVEEIWDANGKVLAEVSKRPLREGVQPDSTERAEQEVQRRNVAWRPDGQGLSYLQMEARRDTTGADSAAGAPAARGAQRAPAQQGQSQGQAQQQRRRDRVVQWLPPFDSASAKVIYEADARIGTLRYSDDATTLFITEGAGGGGGFGGGGGGGGGGAQGGQVHEYAVFLDEPTRRHTIARYRSNDFYKLPGTIMTKRGVQGAPVVQTSSDGGHVYVQGTQYYENRLEQAPRHFIDKVEIRTGTKTRVYEGPEDVYETVQATVDDDLERLIVQRESPTQVPDSYLRTVATGDLRKLTDNRDYTPELTRAQRRTVTVTRVDGIKFNVNVTLPETWTPGQRLPALFWFYPREYNGQEAYDRTLRTFNKNRFPNIGVRTMDILVKQGYAVVAPDAPIIGQDGRMNDRYVSDLRNNLAAVIDELDRQGYIDRQRLGIGGHSYGAFSTVNAMVHTPFFKAGIAGDGAYNRTLTPNGFQTERRLLWEGRETYLAMSPFLYAEQLNGALLMYHGMDDQNVGTHPINSERLFHALNGLGKTASLYMYPYEDHGPATEETILDLWARWTAWLDKYVKNGGAVVADKVAADVRPE
ncbi:MAG TPA: prolyl oligopeptidase family serine peptidase [Gemmatimonadaceae bacterium]|nr:prolyl oligopeptidase family serine peptidase [Gemmatimonadaceae bacterium]